VTGQAVRYQWLSLKPTLKNDRKRNGWFQLKIFRKLPFNRAMAPFLKLKSAGLGALVAQVFVSTDNALQP